MAPGPIKRGRKPKAEMDEEQAKNGKSKVGGTAAINKIIANVYKFIQTQKDANKTLDNVRSFALLAPCSFAFPRRANVSYKIRLC